MAAKEIFFSPALNVMGGYYIPVRNPWNYKLVYRHISEKEKEMYEQNFGEEILSDDEFYDWWKKLKLNQ